jgi:hypothetical protein
MQPKNVNLKRAKVRKRASRGCGSLVKVANLSYSLANSPAPALALAIAVTTYPPKLDVNLSDAILTGDVLRLQAASEMTFINKLFDLAHVISPNVAVSRAALMQGLSVIASPAVTFFRARIERGEAFTEWSNVLKHGESNPPLITSNAVTAYAELAPLVHNLTASETVAWSIVGGRDASLLEIQGSMLRLSGNTPLDHEVQSNYELTVRATDLGGNKTDQNIVLTVSNVGEQANSFTFLTTENGVLSNIYTSNLVNITGLAPGVSVPVKINNGSYSKNGAPFSTSFGTATNGDTFALRTQTSADYSSTKSAVLTLGGGAEAVSGKFTVTTMADPQGIAWIPEPPPPFQLVNYQTNFAEFDNVHFTDGLGVILVSSTGRPIDRCTVDGVNAELVCQSGAKNAHASIWSVPIASAGVKKVRLGHSSLFLGPVAISNGTFKRCRPVALQTASHEYGFFPSPTSLGARLILPQHGFGLVLAVSESGQLVPTWAEAEEGSNIMGGKANAINHAVAHVVRSGTPAIAGWGWSGTGMAAAVWGPQ